MKRIFTKYEDYLLEKKIKLASKRSQEERNNKKKIAEKRRLEKYLEFFKKYVDEGSKGNIIMSKIDPSQEKLPDFVKKIGGDLSLVDSDILKLPDGLHVQGYLRLAQNFHDEIILGDNTKIDGSIILDVNDTSGDSVIYQIGKILTVGGDVQVHEYTLFGLIDGLHVKGNLDISYSGASSLPDDLKVEGDLDIRGTGIQNDVVARKQLKSGYVKGKIYW